MTKVCITFEAEDWAGLTAQMRACLWPDAKAARMPIHEGEPAQTLGRFPDDIPSEDEINTAAFHDAMTKPDPAPTPAPAPKRSHRKAPAPAPAAAAPPTPAPAPAPEPEPELEPEPRQTLDALKQIVTRAVRAAQKGEGPKDILEMLPKFKAATKLDFVMNAEEQHYEALNDLIVEAGLA